ncbi:MAG: ABC transporter permease [Planctomycetota bacterium]
MTPGKPSDNEGQSVNPMVEDTEAIETDVQQISSVSVSASTVSEHDNVSLPEVIYTADSLLRRPGRLIREMIHDLLASRELAWRLFVRDLSAQYRLSYLGYLWVFLPPLATMGVWVFLNKQGIMSVAETPVPYPVFVLTGLLLWEGFSAALNSPLQVVRDAASMLTKINFPREALLVAGFGHVLFNTVIRLTLLAIVFIWFQVSVPWTVILAPLGMLSVLMLGFTIGLILVPVGMLYQDISRGLLMVTTFWFFLTPVVYPPPTSWPGSILNSMNPVSPVLLATRDLLTTGDLARMPESLIVAGLTLAFFLIAWVSYRLALPHLIARMSS